MDRRCACLTNAPAFSVTLRHVARLHHALAHHSRLAEQDHLQSSTPFDRPDERDGGGRRPGLQCEEGAPRVPKGPHCRSSIAAVLFARRRRRGGGVDDLSYRRHRLGRGAASPPPLLASALPPERCAYAIGPLRIARAAPVASAHTFTPWPQPSPSPMLERAGSSTRRR